MKTQITFFTFILSLMFMAVSAQAASVVELYRCEQVYSSPENGLSLRVFKDTAADVTQIELNRISGGRSEVKKYEVQADGSQTSGYPVIYKGAGIMLKISMASSPYADGKRLATLITIEENGEPDSESMHCEVINP